MTTLPETVLVSAAHDWHEAPPAVQAIYVRIRLALPHLSEQLRPELSFTECGGDSLDLVELLCLLECDYGIRLTVDDLQDLRTMGDLLALIDRRATKRPAALALMVPHP